jgi:undecaprenyl pyrophosphate synthase
MKRIAYNFTYTNEQGVEVEVKDVTLFHVEDENQFAALAEVESLVEETTKWWDKCREVEESAKKKYGRRNIDYSTVLNEREQEIRRQNDLEEDEETDYTMDEYWAYQKKLRTIFDSLEQQCIDEIKALTPELTLLREYNPTVLEAYYKAPVVPFNSYITDLNIY